MLKVREDHVCSVLDEAKRRLGEVTKDQSKYADILYTLILQGLYQIMEPKTLIKVRQVDEALVRGLLDRAKAEYKDKIGKDVALEVDTKAYLGADTCGGVELSALNGRIRVIIIITYNYSLIVYLQSIIFFLF